MKLALICCVLMAFSAGVTGQQQTAKPIDYETYCKLPDTESKRGAFLAADAANRGALVKTHIERWRDANQTRLDEKQKAALTAFLKVLTADTYADGPNGQEPRAKSREASVEIERLFNSADLIAMQPDAPCIAKK